MLCKQIGIRMTEADIIQLVKSKLKIETTVRVDTGHFDIGYLSNRVMVEIQTNLSFGDEVISSSTDYDSIDLPIEGP